MAIFPSKLLIDCWDDTAPTSTSYADRALLRSSSSLSFIPLPLKSETLSRVPLRKVIATQFPSALEKSPPLSSASFWQERSVALEKILEKQDFQ